NKLNFHIQFASNFLNLGQEEKIVHKSIYLSGRVLTLLQWLQFATSLPGTVAVMEPSLAGTSSILGAVTVVHRTDKDSAAALSPVVAVITVAVVAVLSTAGASGPLPLSLLSAL